MNMLYEAIKERGSMVIVPSSAVETMGLGGTLATASDVLFYCDDSGAFVAADATDGKPLWSFQTSQLWKASPMTYQFDGKQYVAVAAGSNILAFALPD